MVDQKLSINWDDLRTRRVENRLREQDAMERNRAYAQMQEEALPQATTPARSIFNNAIFCMTVFGLIGGLLAWGAGTLIAGPLTPVIGAVFHYDPAARTDCANRLAEIQHIELRRDTGQLDAAQAQVAIEEVRDDGRSNPYFRIASDPSFSDARRRVETADLEANDRHAEFLINLLSYGLCGMMIAMCLSVAEPVTQRKTKGAFVNAGAGAAAGLLGGVAAALLIERISALAGALSTGPAAWLRQALAWGMLGLFLGLGPGLVLRNVRKLMVGAVGGLSGGLIGGALVNPITRISHGAAIGQLVAFVAIGVVAGLATGLLENVIKSGWLKVTSGVIAGKQFILYRNPTYIGASPDCQIYLFKDPQVGKRHAAIHLLSSGIEIEDLPLGAATLVNGKPVRRVKLKNGDTVQIGATSFRFLQKRPAPGA